MFTSKWFSGAWGLYKNGTTTKITSYDSIIDVSFDGASVITMYPVERGAFLSVGKVQKPSVVKVTIAKTLGILDDVLTTDTKYFSTRKTIIDLTRYKLTASRVDIATPHMAYLGYSLIDFSYSHTADSTGYMLLAELTFQEVRDLHVTGSIDPAEIEFAEKKDVGNVTTTPAEKLGG